MPLSETIYLVPVRYLKTIQVVTCTISITCLIQLKISQSISLKHKHAFKSQHVDTSYFGFSEFHDTRYLYRLSFIWILRLYLYVNIILLTH